MKPQTLSNPPYERRNTVLQTQTTSYQKDILAIDTRNILPNSRL